MVLFYFLAAHLASMQVEIKRLLILEVIAGRGIDPADRMKALPGNGIVAIRPAAFLCGGAGTDNRKRREF